MTDGPSANRVRIALTLDPNVKNWIESNCGERGISSFVEDLIVASQAEYQLLGTPTAASLAQFGANADVVERLEGMLGMQLEPAQKLALKRKFEVLQRIFADQLPPSKRSSSMDKIESVSNAHGTQTATRQRLLDALLQARGLKSSVANIFNQIRNENRPSRDRDRRNDRSESWSSNVIRDLEICVRHMASVEASLDAAIALAPNQVN